MSQATQIRRLIIEMAIPEITHHLGSAMSCVEILDTLYADILKVDPENPAWTKRDIFILSKGHAASALYATLHLKGFFNKKELLKFDQNDGWSEHASFGIPGVELSTGSLGHGLPVGLGFALSFKQAQKLNRVFVLMSDGELNEGSNWEAINFAAHHKLNNVTAIVDLNGFQGYDKTRQVINLKPLAAKFAAHGWEVFSGDGHDQAWLKQVLLQPTTTQPRVIIAKTIKGKGLGEWEGQFASHYHSLTANEKTKLLNNL